VQVACGAGLFNEGRRRMAQQSASPSMLAEYELELAAREAELNRREATVRRAEESRAEADERSAALDRRDRELERVLEAVETQRVRLDEVVAEYESRRETLKLRTREVEAERDRLRQEQARLVAASMGGDEMTEDAPPPKKVEVGADWWSKQLGTPLEAA
jgi:chromosome segregation ATPase